MPPHSRLPATHPAGHRTRSSPRMAPTVGTTIEGKPCRPTRPTCGRLTSIARSRRHSGPAVVADTGAAASGGCRRSPVVACCGCPPRAKIVLAAPTGRAAKRLTELSGHPATTVHRLLQLRPGGDPSFDRDHPLDADLIVVDEASMLDLILANKLIKAVPPGAHLLLVRGRGSAALGRRRGGAARRAGRRHHPPGPAHDDFPAGPAVRGGGQRAPDQRRPAPGVR